MRFRNDRLTGGHVIMLGSGNERAAIEALNEYPGGLQVGGGMTADNGKRFLDEGASHIILTSWVFQDGRIAPERIRLMQKRIGKKRMVLDLSCRKKGADYYVVTNRWRTFTHTRISEKNITSLGRCCDELLIHAVDVEGKCSGMDRELVEKLSRWGDGVITYAGGASSIEDLEWVERIGNGRIHLTIGSALDIFGGTLVRYQDAVEFNRRAAEYSPT
jgi:phosphoribosylformimino-5-aminoimidazole carboxamide ribotide isomerase